MDKIHRVHSESYVFEIDKTTDTVDIMMEAEPVFSTMTWNVACEDFRKLLLALPNFKAAKGDSWEIGFFNGAGEYLAPFCDLTLYFGRSSICFCMSQDEMKMLAQRWSGEFQKEEERIRLGDAWVETYSED